MRLRPRLLWTSLLAVALLAALLVWWRTSSRPGHNPVLGGRISGPPYEGTAHDAVFLLVIDTLRADRLACYGATAPQTPNIDRLADEGVLFAEAHSVASWTRPSVAAILTSLYPSQLGLVEKPGPPGKRWKWREPRKQLSRTLPEDETTLAEIFEDAGFTTAAFVNQPALNHQRGFQQGFHQWRYPISADEVVLMDPAQKFAAQSWLSTQYADRADASLIEAFDDWMSAQARDEKLFVYLHLLTPHQPYLPRGPFAPENENASDSELYDGEVRMADAMLGRILAIIDEQCAGRRSLIVFTSDHGEEFGDHGMQEHGHSLHREVVRVPLILRSSALPHPTSVSPLVRTVDIMPTILELSGLEPARGAMGVSLVPLIEGGTAALPLYSEAMLYGSTERCLAEDGHKLMYDEQGEHWRLFDLTEDPLETRDLAGDRPELVDTMRSRLVAAHRALVEDRVERMEGYETQLDPEELEREEARAREALKALGYID